jgi:hypothetical protein
LLAVSRLEARGGLGEGQSARTRSNIASAGQSRHHGGMDGIDQRRHRRESVTLAVVVTPSGAKPVTAVIDLSEGGTCLDWTLRDDISLGTPVHLCFLLDGQQAIEIDGRIVRVGSGHAGIEFLPAQQDLVRQLLAEARSDL